MSVRELAFAIYGRRAGLIVRDRHLVTLRYDDDYLAWPEATPLSLSMPLVGGAYTARPVLAFLKGLLPDNPAVRERWARRFGVRAGDTLGLVAAIGGDTAGGAVFAAPDELDSLLARPSRVEAISHGEVAARLRQLREDDDAWLGESDEHWSLAGAQGKFTLVQLDDGGWFWALGGTQSDVDTTGRVLQIISGVAQVPAPDAYARAAGWLAEIQLPEGDWNTGATPGPANSNSTALAVGGLLAAGYDPQAAPYLKGSVSALDALLAFQEPSGAFIYINLPGQEEVRVMATADALTALAPLISGGPVCKSIYLPVLLAH